MDANQIQLGEMHGHAVQRHGAPDVGQPAVFLVHQAVTHLHHDGNLQLCAPGVVGIPDRTVGCLVKPMWVEMRTHKTICLDRHVQLFQTRNASGRVQAGQARKTIGVFGAYLGHPFIRYFGRATHPQVTTAGGNEQRPLYSSTIHFFQVLLHGDAIAVGRVQPHLVQKISIRGDAVFGNRFGRIDVDHNVNRAVAPLGIFRFERIGMWRAGFGR